MATKKHAVDYALGRVESFRVKEQETEVYLRRAETEQEREKWRAVVRQWRIAYRMAFDVLQEWQALPEEFFDRLTDDHFDKPLDEDGC